MGIHWEIYSGYIGNMNSPLPPYTRNPSQGQKGSSYKNTIAHHQTLLHERRWPKKLKCNRWALTNNCKHALHTWSRINIKPTHGMLCFSRLTVLQIVATMSRYCVNGTSIPQIVICLKLFKIRLATLGPRDIVISLNVEISNQTSCVFKG